MPAGRCQAHPRGRQRGHHHAGRVQPVDEANPHPGEQQARDGRTRHLADLQQGLEHGVHGGRVRSSRQVRQHRGQPRLAGDRAAGGHGGQDEQRPQGGADGGVDRQADGAQGGQQLRGQQQGPAVDGVGERSAHQSPGDQRQQLRQRDKSDIKRRTRQRVDLVRHRDRGELAAEHDHELPAEQAAKIAGLPQRPDVDHQMPPDPGDALHRSDPNQLTDRQSIE